MALVSLEGYRAMDNDVATRNALRHHIAALLMELDAAADALYLEVCGDADTRVIQKITHFVRDYDIQGFIDWWHE